MALSVSPRRLEAAVIEFGSMKFIITERPSDASMDHFLSIVKRYQATDVVRVGGDPYKTFQLQGEGVNVLDLSFEDGTTPSSEIIQKWCNLLRLRNGMVPCGSIVVHCVAGLGRAPVMVAVALIELGMRYEDAVEMIRVKRRGAINAKQLDFLATYRRQTRLKIKGRKTCAVV